MENLDKLDILHKQARKVLDEISIQKLRQKELQIYMDDARRTNAARSRWAISERHVAQGMQKNIDLYKQILEQINSINL